jgi:DNA-binding MarR family transcriptional regulator
MDSLSSEPRPWQGPPDPQPTRIGPQAQLLLELIHWSSTASRQLRRQLAELASEFDLSDSELLVLWLCDDSGWVQVDLATAIGVSPAQMSGIVDRLGCRNLVAMHRPSIDRRRQVWRTTASGQELLGRAANHLESLAASLQSLSSDEQQIATKLCHRLTEGAGASEERSRKEAA